MRRDSPHAPGRVPAGARRMTLTALALAGWASLAPPVWAAAPQDTIRTLVGAAARVLEDPALQGPANAGARRARIGTIIREAFAFESMARDALGAPWATLTAAQRAEFAQLFGDRFARSYSVLVLRFLGERTTAYVGQSIHGEDAVVRTVLVSPGDGKLPVDYRLTSHEARWRVADVVVDGVSLTENYRVQFGRLLRTSSYETLLRRMQRSVE